MKQQFDKELRDHIKDTFDVYDDLMEDDGWLKYERKVKRKKHRAIFMWSFPSGMAAALALVWLLNIGSYDALDDKNKIKIATNNPSQKLEEKSYPSPKNKDINKKNSLSGVESLKEKPVSLPNDDVNNTITNSVATEVVNIMAAETSTVISDAELPVNSAFIAENETSVPVINEKTPVIKETIATPSQSEFAANTSQENKNPFNQQETGFNNTFSDLAINAYADENEEISTKKSDSKKMKVGVDASTFMNFTKDGVGQDMNLGVGLVSEYKISKNFSINSGININKQSASYTANSGDVRESAKSSAMFSSLAPMATPVINQQSSNAKLVGFDIPFAIKYSSNNKKTLNWFLSTGFSSYTLLTETYLNNISVVNYGISGIQTTNEVITEEHKDGLFSNLQLARTLNFSVGLQFPIKNFTSLSVEPFIKYPLRSFGREDLTIGSSGVSLKMNLDKRLFK